MSLQTDHQKMTSETEIEVRCTGNVRGVVGEGSLAYSFEGETLRDFLDVFFAEYPIREMIIAKTEGEAIAHGWAPTPDNVPGRSRKNPEGEQTRRYARVTVNGVFNEHLEGLDTPLNDGDRVALMYPFMFCV